ncbi:MAG TPA: hypothetical protein VG603_07445, partial [Chitinophagales bacterium]|nr:hypothetical protein [Chitinophagales bacterium]
MIDGPTTAVVGKPVKYSEISGKGSSWQWTSTESGQVDGTASEITYSFTKPGKQTVYVTINGKAKASLDVDVAAVASGSGGGAGKPKVDEATFKNMLYQVIRGKSNAGIFGTVLCGHLNMPVDFIEKSTKKQKPFMDYCMSLDKKTKIDEVKLKYDAAGCVTEIEIKQHKKGLFEKD